MMHAEEEDVDDLHEGEDGETECAYPMSTNEETHPEPEWVVESGKGEEARTPSPGPSDRRP